MRRITRAPASLTAKTLDPAWLTDPTSANYVAPALRDPNAVKLLAVVPSAERGGPAAIPHLVAQHQQHAAGSGAGRLRPQPELAAHRPLHARQQLHTEEPGGLFLGLAVPNVATTDTNVPGQVGSANLRSTHRRLERSERVAVPVLEQHDRRHQSEPRPEPALVARPQHPRGVPEQRHGRDAAGHRHRNCRPSAPTSCTTSSTRTTRSPTASPGSAERTRSSSAG